MNQPKNKRFYKGISLFIKSLVLLVSIWYIWKKLSESPAVFDTSLFDQGRIFYGLIIFLLVFVNWGLEAYKWKLLAAPLEVISFSSAYKAVLSGISISLLTPNRVGEFAARVLFLEKADRGVASLASLVGSMVQLAVTVLAGIFGWFFLERKYHDFFNTEEFISSGSAMSLIIAMAILFYLVWKFYLKKIPGLKKYSDVSGMYSKDQMNRIWSISFLRYSVFSLQYYLTLQLFGINGGVMILLSLIALTFLATSAIPTFALTEIAVRAGAAVYFFSTISNDLNGIIASSLFLWIMNIAFPSLLGTLFIWKLKLFREN